jgi:hypothetical protein
MVKECEKRERDEESRIGDIERTLYRRGMIIFQLDHHLRETSFLLVISDLEPRSGPDMRVLVWDGMRGISLDCNSFLPSGVGAVQILLDCNYSTGFPAAGVGMVKTLSHDWLPTTIAAGASSHLPGL